jgi:hypothetical protein
VTRQASATAHSEWPKLVEKYAIEDAQVAPMVTLVANDNWLEYNVRYVTNYHRRRVTKSEMFTRLMDEFEKVPDRVSIASATHDIVAFPPLNVHVTGGDDLKR